MTDYSDPAVRDAEAHEAEEDAYTDREWERIAHACGACGQLVDVEDRDCYGEPHDCDLDDTEDHRITLRHP